MAKIDVQLHTNSIFVGSLQYFQCYISKSIRSSSNYLWFCVFHSQVIETGSTYPHWLVQLLPRDGNAVSRAFWTEYFTTTPERRRKMNITKAVRFCEGHALYKQKQKLLDLYNIIFHHKQWTLLLMQQYLKEALIGISNNRGWIII